MIKKYHNKLKQIDKIMLTVMGLALVGLIAMALSIFLTRDSAGAKRLVTFYDYGTKRSILTRADTVKQALKAAQIEVDANDIVDPARDSRLDDPYVDVIIYRSRTVAVVDGSRRQSVMTVAQSPNKILEEVGFASLESEDKTSFRLGSTASDGAVVVLSVERAKPDPEPESKQIVFTPRPDALTRSKGAQVFVDSSGVAHRETYYDLPMNIVIGACGAQGLYTVRSDGAKIDQDGYVLVAANYGAYPRCSVVETSLGPGKVYDTGGFALRHPYGFDLATDWTNYNGL